MIQSTSYFQDQALKINSPRHLSRASKSKLGRYYTYRGSRFDWYVGLSYLLQKIRESSPLKTAFPIIIVRTIILIFF